jgi:hypothetical protein
VFLPQPVTSRRTAMGGALAGLVVVSGCDADPGPAATPRAETTAPPVDADAELVDQVAERIATASVSVAAARMQSPQLRRSLRPLQRMHAEHLAVLEVRAEPADGQPVARDVRAAETTLQRQLADAAVRAESGALAKLLASMAAAVAQQLAVLR